MKNILFLLLICFAGADLSGQSSFHKSYQNNNQFFYTHSLTPLSNGNLLLCNAANNTSIASLIALTDQGQLLWHKKYAPLLLFSASIESDSGIIAFGNGKTGAGQNTQSYGALVDLAADGSVISARKFNYGQDYTEINGLLKTSDSYLLTGFSQSFTFPNIQKSIIIRVSDEGQVLWSKSYSSGFQFNYFQARRILGDTLLACGNIRGNACLVRINLNTGDVIGVTALGGPFMDEFSTLESTPDGNLLLAGTTRSSTADEYSRPMVVKMTPSGQILWTKTYNLPDLESDCFITKAGAGYFVLSISSHFVAIDENGVLLWAKNYAGSQKFEFEEICTSPDGGFFSYGQETLESQIVLKTDAFGNIANGCCPAPVVFDVTTINPPQFNYALTIDDYPLVLEPISVTQIADDLDLNEYCQIPVTSLDIYASLCPKDSLEIDGAFYTAPNTVRDTVSSFDGACDTVKVYHLILAPEPFVVKTIKFCKGTSVNINGTEYTQPGTVTEMIPAVSGCDTLLAYVLQYAPLPFRNDSIYFCQGDTAWVGGNAYIFPGLVTDTLAGQGNDCDTLLRHFLFWLNTANSNVSIHCPDDILIHSSHAEPVVYPSVSASSDCVCPNLSINLGQGLPSGAVFPPGSTKVCYTVQDACYSTASCCFSVNIEDEKACDVKEIGCLKFELLSISTDQAQNRSYRIRVTNSCHLPLSYAAFELPSALSCISPEQGTIYTSAYGNLYDIRNPNHMPFRSVRFKSRNTGISNGASDVFEYTLPAQVNPTFIHVAGSLGPNALYETILNTFGCAVQPVNRAAEASATGNSEETMRIFPNPSKGRLVIVTAGRLESDRRIFVRNAHGELVLKDILPAGETGRDIEIPEEMPNGLYWLSLDAVQAAKFILMR